MKNILIVDDDVYVGNMLDELLTKEGYSTTRAYSGTEALLAAAAYRPDLILLDLMLPGLNGEEILPEFEGIPVIVVSAKTDTADKVELLLGGAEDYVTKPFDTDELLARIAVQLRKSSGLIPSDVLKAADLTLDMKTHTALACDKEVKLTRTEYAILKILMQNQFQVITKTVMLERIGMDTPDCTESSLKMHISNLRKKLREAAGKDYIESIWGIGFKLKEE